MERYKQLVIQHFLFILRLLRSQWDISTQVYSCMTWTKRILLRTDKVGLSGSTIKVSRLNKQMQMHATWWKIYVVKDMRSSRPEKYACTQNIIFCVIFVINSHFGTTKPKNFECDKKSEFENPHTCMFLKIDPAADIFLAWTDIQNYKQVCH